MIFNYMLIGTLAVVLVVVFPEIATWLPRRMSG